jgi:thiosulfate dehydrogenase
MLIRYGRELIANTSFYLGPTGKIASISNGMNCQNCHLDAGTRFWGNNYSAVFSTYPKFRDRSGTIESIYKRVNDCLQRSLDGEELDTASREMQAIYAYIKWLGKDVPKGARPPGVGISDIPYPERAADTVRGQLIYSTKCVACHGPQGAGMWNADSGRYTYPPLWGTHSYNTGAGLFRLSRLAGYIRYNMPFGASYNAPQLSDSEAWDVAAYINSRPRPQKAFPSDWPDISRKPFDHPFGPYADSFSEGQHKYGPFAPIKSVHRLF